MGVTSMVGGTSKWVCLDVGETLLDETRFWEGWADLLGVPRMTFLAAAGAVIVRRGDHQDVCKASLHEFPLVP